MYYPGPIKLCRCPHGTPYMTALTPWDPLDNPLDLQTKPHHQETIWSLLQSLPLVLLKHIILSTSSRGPFLANWIINVKELSYILGDSSFEMLIGWVEG